MHPDTRGRQCTFSTWVAGPKLMDDWDFYEREREITGCVWEDGEPQSPYVEESEPNGGQSERTHQHQPPS